MNRLTASTPICFLELNTLFSFLEIIKRRPLIKVVFWNAPRGDISCQLHCVFQLLFWRWMQAFQLTLFLNSNTERHYLQSNLHWCLASLRIYEKHAFWHAGNETCMPVCHIKLLEQTEIHKVEDKLSSQINSVYFLEWKQSSILVSPCKPTVAICTNYSSCCLVSSYRPVLQSPNDILSYAFTANRPGRKTLSWS